MQKLALMIITAIMLSFAAILGYWVQDHHELPTIVHEEVIVTPAVHPGDFIKVRLDVERLRNDCQIQIERLIYDGENTRMPREDENFEAQPGPLGRNKLFFEKVWVPSYAATGEGFYRAIRSYWCNPLEKILRWARVIRTDDHAFRIVPRGRHLPDGSGFNSPRVRTR